MHVVYRDEKVRQPSLSRFYATITYASAPGRQAHALDVATQILGGSETSWLYRTLVEQRHLAVGVYANADLSGLGGGTISIGATPAEGVSLQTLEAAIDEVVAQFLRDGPTDAELTRAKSQLVAATIYAQDSQEALANMYGSSLAQGETMDAIVQWPDQIEHVTRDEVLTSARAALNAKASVTGWLMPPETAP
jgi:zinc protease